MAMTREERQIKEAFIDGYLSCVTGRLLGDERDFEGLAKKAWREENTTNRADSSDQKGQS